MVNKDLYLQEHRTVFGKKNYGIVAIIQKRNFAKFIKSHQKIKRSNSCLGFDLEIFQKIMKKIELTRNKYEIDEYTVAIAIVGRITAIKDHHYFLDVIESVFRSSDKIKIFIVGDGDLKREIEERLIPMQNIGIDISLTSWIYDIAEFNAGMDIMCLTSKNEGTPVSLIEAQASNLRSCEYRGGRSCRYCETK